MSTMDYILKQKKLHNARRQRGAGRVAGNAARQWVVPEALHEIWKVYTHGEEKLLRRRQLNLGGSGWGNSPQKILEFRISEIPFPAFSAGHFSKIMRMKMQ